MKKIILAGKKQHLILKVTVLAGVISLASYFGYKYFTAEPAGYCSAQKRYISDEEFIRTAVALYEWEASRRNIYYDSASVEKNKYDALDNGGFHGWERNRNRPDCCGVFRGNTKSFFRRLFGEQEIEVALYLDPESRGDGFLPFAFDVCGTLLPHKWGYHLSTNMIVPAHALTTRN